jgi:hypothetical protein
MYVMLHIFRPVALHMNFFITNRCTTIIFIPTYFGCEKWLPDDGYSG